ncbi:MAG TPA: murein biosynthesis integral membrane protein MurJ [Solirubrobacteraceae bacterium]|nr:murein biosynthesis integral membrane protein MurJ [Solirubrobacteraceae bacterium]
MSEIPADGEPVEEGLPYDDPGALEEGPVEPSHDVVGIPEGDEQSPTDLPDDVLGDLDVGAESPVDPRVEFVGIPDASFGEEYGGLGQPEPEQMAEEGAGPGPGGGRERVARNTAIVSFATGVSRVAGLGREIVAASFFGTGGPASAFTIAFQIPNLVSNLFANAALSAAFVPVFTDLLQQGRKREAFRLASTLFWIMLIVLGAITAVFVLAAGVIMPLFTGPTFNSALDSLTVGLSQVLFPVVLLIGLIGLLVGILQSYEHFTIPAIAPAVWNVVIIVLLVVLRPHFQGGYKNGDQLYAYAIAILVATFVQMLMVFGALRRIDFRLQFSIDWHDPRIRQVFTLMLPVTIGLGIVNLDQLINSVFGTLVSEEAPRAIDNAFRIYMLPQGLFSVAVATVLFPTLSRMAARRDVGNMRRTIGVGMRQINLLLIPSAVFMLVLTTPIVRLIFERGHFDAKSTSLVSEALFWFAFSLPFGGLNLLLTRVFFSVQRPWIPTRLAGLNIVVDIIVSIGLYKPLGIAGLIIGTVAANAVMTALQFHRLRIGFNGSLEGAQTTMITARILLASALLGAVSWVVWTVLDRLFGTSLPAQIVSVGGAAAAGLFVYARAVLVMRIPEAHQVNRLIRTQLGRA